MKKLLPILLLLSCHNTIRLSEVPHCGDKCWINDDIPKGACKYGHLDCPLDGGTEVCVGMTLPSPEICDGLDNNCDGQIDEGLLNCCSIPSVEICDGKDNDCDGIIDNIKPKLCYDGDQSTLAYGECRPGVERCIDGQLVCYGEVVPSKEVCDKKDNDCNGLIDEGLSSKDNIDIVMIFDNSGSMGTVVDNLRIALQGFSQSYTNDTTLRWALVTAPDNDIVKYSNRPHLFLNFSTATDFYNAVALQGSNGSGDEPTLDALYEICQPNNVLGLNWSPNAKRNIIIFTDELPQSYIDKVEVIDVIQACKKAGVAVTTYTDPNDLGWKQICTQTVGLCNDLAGYGIQNTLEDVVGKLTCR